MRFSAGCTWANPIAGSLGISASVATPLPDIGYGAGRHGVLDSGPLPDPATLAGLLTLAPTERPAHEQSLVEPTR